MISLKQYLNENNQILKFVDILITNGPEILLLRRANYLKNFRGKWCLPGGHIDKNENPITTIKRELYEETKIKLDEDPEFCGTYMYSNGDMSNIYKYEIKDKPDIKISSEHAQYKWIYIDDLPKYKEKFAGEGFEIIEKYFINK